jgi:hypothetical protein
LLSFGHWSALGASIVGGGPRKPNLCTVANRRPLARRARLLSFGEAVLLGALAEFKT